RSRQGGAEAVVRPPAAEAQVAVWVSAQVEAPRVLERTLVSVGRVVEEHHLLPRSQALAMQLDLAGRGASERKHRRGPAHELLDGRRQALLQVVHQQLALGGVDGQGTHRMRARV